MIISLIVAHAKNNVIGNRGTMPWHLPADLAHFKKTTFGSPVIMGRVTFESIGRPLPGRLNIVISTNPHYVVPNGVVLAQSLEQAIAIATKLQDPKEVFIIGGGRIYQQAIKYADRLYLTIIDADIAGDTKFPDYQEQDFDVLEQTEYPADDKNAYHLTFKTLQRKSAVRI